MPSSRRTVTWSLALSLLATGAATAASPSFDCAKASGAAEQAICQDDTLAALDRETARLYGLALGTRGLAAQRRKELVAYQRGWIKGLNECWKADDLKTCIRDSAMARIGALRAQFPAARGDDRRGVSLGPVAVHCPDGGAAIQATFVNVEPPMALLSWPERDLVLTIARSASGARYTASGPQGDALFWQKGREAIVQLPGGHEQVCSVADLR